MNFNGNINPEELGGDLLSDGLSGCLKAAIGDERADFFLTNKRLREEVQPFLRGEMPVNDFCDLVWPLASKALDVGRALTRFLVEQKNFEHVLEGISNDALALAGFAIYAENDTALFRVPMWADWSLNRWARAYKEAKILADRIRRGQETKRRRGISFQGLYAAGRDF
ncbi:MAG: hypothetical protein ACOC7M_02425 [Chloroflexota bacterium]